MLIRRLARALVTGWLLASEEADSEVFAGWYWPWPWDRVVVGFTANRTEHVAERRVCHVKPNRQLLVGSWRCSTVLPHYHGRQVMRDAPSAVWWSVCEIKQPFLCSATAFLTAENRKRRYP